MNSTLKNGQSRRWWAESDVAKLKELSQTKSDEEIADLLGRSVQAIRDQRIKLGIEKVNSKRRKWTAADYALLESLAFEKSDEDLAQMMNRTLEGIAHKRRKINAKYSLWSNEEIEQLKKWALDKTDEEIGKTLGRSKMAVRTMRHQLGIKGREQVAWSDSELEELRSVARHHTFSELGKILGRDPKVVAQKCKQLRLKTKTQPLKRWTPEEDRKLFDLTGQGLSDSKIATLLGRPSASIAGRRYHLKEKEESRKSGKWTADEDEQLRLMHTIDRLNVPLIALKLGRTKNSVHSRLRGLGLK